MKRLLTISMLGLLGLVGTADAEAALDAPRSTSYAYYPTNVCITPVTSCWMPVTLPAGSSCWCATPWGPSYGRAS